MPNKITNEHDRVALMVRPYLLAKLKLNAFCRNYIYAQYGEAVLSAYWTLYYKQPYDDDRINTIKTIFTNNVTKWAQRYAIGVPTNQLSMLDIWTTKLVLVLESLLDKALVNATDSYGPEHLYQALADKLQTIVDHDCDSQWLNSDWLMEIANAVNEYHKQVQKLVTTNGNQ